MKSEEDRMLCYICGAAPIRRICLAEECLRDKKFLYCDNCRKQDLMRKYASQSYEIDSYSAPVSLLSINSTSKQEAKKVHQSVQSCRQSAQPKVASVYDLLMDIDQKILKRVQQLQSTFDSETAQRVQEELKNHSSNERQQILKKVLTLKWFRQNKEPLSNASLLSQKISTFAKNFDEGIGILMAKIESLVQEFYAEFNMDNFFVEKKKQQKQAFKQKQSIVANKNVKKNKISDKMENGKPFIIEPIKPQKPNDSIKPKILNSENKMELENEYEIQNATNIQKSKQKIPASEQIQYERFVFPPSFVKEEMNVEFSRQKQSSEVRPPSVSEQKKIKKKSLKSISQKQKQSKEDEQLNKAPPLVLQRIQTKSDYLEEEKLIINLKNIAEIFWILNENEQKTPKPVKQEPKVKYEHGAEKIIEQRVRFSNFIDSKKTISLENIKYLQVQQLPKRSVEIFTIEVDGKQTKVKYSIEKLYQKIGQMESLEQLHIFTSVLFPSEQQLLTIMFTCPNLKVVAFSCFNPIIKMLPRYKEIIEDQFNKEIKVLEMAGNVPFWQDIQIADLKSYFPESEKNKKIFDERFAKNFQEFVQNQKKYIADQINNKQKFENRNSCWFIPQDKTLIEKQRNSNILKPEQNKLLAQCFRQLRSCWIPYLTSEYLAQKQQLSQIEKVQHLNLGFHYFVLQPIPWTFFFGDNPFLKSLVNLKSLNLVNLNINQMFMIKFFCPRWKELISLKIQNCMGLKNDFYKALPNHCPKLRKICVNNLESGIDGDFLTKFEQLQTIILPWSQLVYKRSQKLVELENKQNGAIVEQKQNNAIVEEHLNGFKLKNWKYVNLYGCSWFHTDFFALMNLESLEHINIGKCSNLNIKDLIYYLQRCINLQSLCLDEIPLTNKDLFSILRCLPQLYRLSLAHCPNINFSFRNLEPDEIQLLDRMTHLDLRNENHHIAFQYTMKMINPKYLIVSRGFELEQNEPQVLAQRQINACSTSY